MAAMFGDDRLDRAQPKSCALWPFRSDERLEYPILDLLRDPCAVVHEHNARFLARTLRFDLDPPLAWNGLNSVYQELYPALKSSFVKMS